MEGRVLLRCGECGRTREVSGEMPGEYIRRFAEAVQEDGWVPRPGADVALIDGVCLATKFGGHETMDDQMKVLGLRDPKET